MIKTIASYYLILNIMVGSLMMPLIHIDFKLRKDYIYKVLCINRDKPITVCGGQCYLNEQFKKAAEHQEDKPNVRGSVEISFFNQRISELILPTINKLENDQIRPTISSDNPKSFIEYIFKPPRFS